MKFKARPIKNSEFSVLSASTESVMQKLFSSRGVDNPEQVIVGIGQMLMPTQFKSLDAAGELMAQYIAQGKRITIVADFDCDGACACAIMMRGLKILGAKEGTVNYLVPNRVLDGYGLTPPIVDRAIEQFQAEIIVTVDNGIASLEGVAHAIKLGLQVVVTDHHLPAMVEGEIKLPNATVIIDPHQPGCGFESKHICGAGVAFYLILMTRSIMRKAGVFTIETQPKEEIDNLFQLVALATVADVVALDRNNRCMVAHGLKRIRSKSVYPGIAALFSVAGKNNEQATSIDMGFTIGPRINAAGRMDDMAIGIKSLINDDKELAQNYANELHQFNVKRRKVQEEMGKEAQKIIDEFNEEISLNAIVIHKPSFHEGVIGIVSGKLKEQYNRPAFVFANTHNEDEIKGSGRSIPGLHLRDALDLIAKRHPDLFKRFGGHSMAAGCTIRKDGLAIFQAELSKIVETQMTKEQLEQVILTDGPLPDNCFDVDMAESIGKMVWGNGFEEPIFMDNFKIVSQQVLKETHLKLVLKSGNQKREAIWFFRAEPLREEDDIGIAYKLSINEWQGRKTAQMMVVGAEG